MRQDGLKTVNISEVFHLQCLAKYIAVDLQEWTECRYRNSSRENVDLTHLGNHLFSCVPDACSISNVDANCEGDAPNLFDLIG